MQTLKVQRRGEKRMPTTEVYGWALRFNANRTHWNHETLQAHGEITGPADKSFPSFCLVETFPTKAEANARLRELCNTGAVEMASNNWRMKRSMVPR